MIMEKHKVLDVKKIKSYGKVPVNEEGTGTGFYPKHKLEVIDALCEKFEGNYRNDDAEEVFLTGSLLVISGVLLFFSVLGFSTPEEEGVRRVLSSPPVLGFSFGIMGVLIGAMGVASLRPLVGSRRTIFPAVNANVAGFEEWVKTTQGKNITVDPYELHMAMKKGTKYALVVTKDGSRFTLSRIEGDQEQYTVSYMPHKSVSKKKTEIAEPVVLSGAVGEKYNTVMKTLDTLSKVELSQWESLTLESLKNDMVTLHATAVELEKLGSVDNNEVLVVLDELEFSVAELVEGRKKHLEQSLVSLKKFHVT